MTVKEYSQQLQEGLKNEGLTPEATDLVALSKTVMALRDALANLKAFVRSYKFKSTTEEIDFFKEIKPLFHSQLIYHKIVFKVQLHRSYQGDAETCFYEGYLKRFERFVRKNEPFMQYCMSGHTSHDRLYFTRTIGTMSNLDKDETFTTGFDAKLARLLAYQLVREYLHSAILKKVKTTAPDSPLLAWNESKVSAIELAYGLHASGAFGDVTIKQVVTGLEKITGLDLSNYARIFSDIRLRKTNVKPFLDRMSNGFMRHIEELD
ncbi:RteC domain-containing protein [Parachryseolinea silvisoli]|uniref:RteC domain-containing protein n=1 Tax=Parachryseolinea silvisoli TaxID=2873601 RepID=UPI00226594ED|nr:RteC domain-containing protein [Parachryseolinea silvisoli]MCD9015221.1 RteC domain-containing protein [Parachryseolinea silvisoli]